jgi:glycosyltransferase involved in cell wall biosynthesis
MFEYLAAGKAVVGSVTGEAAQILAAAGSVVVPPEDSGSLAAAIAALAADPPLRAEIGRIGRAFVERCHDSGAGPGVEEDSVIAAYARCGSGRSADRPSPIM